MTKRVHDDHEIPREGSDKVKPAGDGTKDNLKNDREVDNKVIEKDRAQEADGFSVTNINVGEIQKANEKLQNSGSAFQLVDNTSGEVIAKSRKPARADDGSGGVDESTSPSSAESSLKTDSALKGHKPERSENMQENYDSATISTKAVHDQQMQIYQKALETTTDPEVRAQLKQQATMLDKMTMASPQQSSDTTFGTRKETQSSAAADAEHEYKDLFNKSIKLGDVKHGKADSHEKSFPSTVQKDSLNRVTHVSNQVADYDFSYARDNNGMETTFPSKVTIAEKSGQKHVYEKKADGWHVDGAKSAGDIKDIFVNSETGKLNIDYTNGAHRINHPDGTVEKITPNRSGIVRPDGRTSINDALGTKFTRTPDGHGGYVDHHSGPRPDDAFMITRKSDGSLEVREKASDKPYKPIDDPHIKVERERLLKQANENIPNTEELSRFHANMARFENREHKMESDLVKQGKTPTEAAKLAHEEIAKTYSQISRLFEAGDKPGVPVNEFKRTIIAEQLMRNASNPSVIDQGCFNTCNVATIEVRTFARHPSDAARLVVDMATNGKYSFHGDKEVRINKEAFQNFSPDDLNPPADSVRSLASQLFQVTAVNIHYALQPSLGAIGQTHYEQLRPSNGDPPDNGERLVTNLPWSKTEHSPRLFAPDIAQISREITKDQPKEAFISFDKNKHSDYDTIADETSLRDKLKYAKEHGMLPITIGVHTGNEPFYTDSGSGTAGGSGGWHVVNVTDYQDGAPPMVTVDNQWGSKIDHTGKNKLTLDDLFFSMRSPTDETQIADLENRRAHRNLNVRQELELDRHKLETGKIKSDAFGTCMEKHLQKASKDLIDNKINYNEYLKFISQFNSKIHDLDASKRLRMAQFENDQGLIEHGAYKDILVETTVVIKVEQAIAKIVKPSDIERDKRYDQAMKQLGQNLRSMSLDEQNEIQTRIADTVRRIRKG